MSSATDLHQKATQYLDANLHHQWRTRRLLVGAASLFETHPGLYDVTLRYDGKARGAAWRALSDSADPTVDPVVYEYLDKGSSMVQDTVHFLLNTCLTYPVTPPALMAVLDSANPSWLGGYAYTAALMLLGPSVEEARDWAEHGTAPTLDEALFMLALKYPDTSTANTSEGAK